jgi:hypothetical protein
MKSNTIKICSRCGSTNIGVTGGVEGHVFDFCKDCNLKNLNEPSDPHLIVEIEKTKVKEFQQHIKKNNT